jgi:hypothetical protein
MLLAAFAALAAGCGHNEIRPTGDAAGVRSAVTQALDAWKAGQSPEELKVVAPVVFINDEDWRAGRRLTGYEVLEEPQQNGSHWRTYVKLLLAGEGSPQAKTVCYAVTPGSPSSIIRSDFLN